MQYLYSLFETDFYQLDVWVNEESQGTHLKNNGVISTSAFLCTFDGIQTVVVHDHLHKADKSRN
jgi:hypothetical protein